MQNLFKYSKINDYIKSQEIKALTEVQAKSIPKFLENLDLSVLAQTGSGKTYAYLFGLIELLKKEEALNDQDWKEAAPRAIIVSPTRELSGQIQHVLRSVSHTCKLKVRAMSGGDESKKIKKVLSESFDILICSPARLLKSLKNKEIKTTHLKHLILDEADQLLDMGFSKDLVEINKIISSKPVQICLYSATMSDKFQEFTKEVFPNKNFLDIYLESGNSLQDNISTYNIYLAHHEKLEMLKIFFAKEIKGKEKGIIFVNNKKDIAKINEFLDANIKQTSFIGLHGELDKKERHEAIEKFRNNFAVLLASDIAARGIDIKDLKWVLNFDLPFEAVYYIHRAGRTGRSGTKGRVYNFVTPKDVDLISRINDTIKNQNALKIDKIEVPRSVSMRKVKVKTHAKTYKEVLANKNKEKREERKKFSSKGKFARRR